MSNHFNWLCEMNSLLLTYVLNASLSSRTKYIKRDQIKLLVILFLTAYSADVNHSGSPIRVSSLLILKNVVDIKYTEYLKLRRSFHYICVCLFVS